MKAKYSVLGSFAARNDDRRPFDETYYKKVWTVWFENLVEKLGEYI